MVDCIAGGRQDLLGSVYRYFGLLDIEASVCIMNCMSVGT